MNIRHEDQQQRQQLLTIVDRGTIEQLFTFLQGFHRRPFQNLADVLVYEGVIDDQIDFIDCTGTKYNVTPLIIAAGKGSYEKTKILLVHGANPNKQCATGDTALNLAVHRQKYSVVDLLLQYHANPNLFNQAGKTALHRAVASYNDENALHIRAILEAGADLTIEDRNQRIPLDEAIIANRPEFVDILLSYDRTLVEHAYRAAIIASRHGHDQCLEILLNYGMNPNIADRTNTIPLHVAVRSLKLSTTRILLANGADPNLANNRGETATSIAEFLQPDQQQEFLNILHHTPQIALSDSHVYRTENAISNIYPLLRNHSNWTLDSDEFRSRTASNSSAQNLLDTNSRTYWCSIKPQNAWVIFDLKHQYNINGVRIIGCENQSTPKNGHFDVSNALNGPWLKVKDFTCLFTQGNKNDFFFPVLTTRFIRVFILDNYGGEDIRIQEISFYGVDTCLLNLLKEYNLENSLDTLLANGINDQETLDENQDKILNSSNKYLHVNDHFQFIRLTESLRSPQLTFLEWFNPPQTTAIAGERFQTFSVAADEGVTNRIKLEEKLENNPQATTVLMRDLEPIQGYSLVDFPDYTIHNPGRYKIRVVSVESPHIHTSWQEIVVGPTSSYASRLNNVADEHLYLSSTANFYNDTTSDKENTLRLKKKTTTTTPIDKDNRAFIIKVYDSENEDTEDDIYLGPQKPIEESPYFFSSPSMFRTNDSALINYQLEPPYKPAHYTQTRIVDYFDHSTNTDEDYDDDNQSLRPFNSNARDKMYLTPTKYRSGSRTPLTNIFPINNINYGKPSEDYDTLTYGDKIIIPTKYRLQQDRLKQLLESENINRSEQQNPYQQRPPPPQQQQMHYQPRQQSHQQNGSLREPLPEQQPHFNELDQLQQRNQPVRELQYQQQDQLQNPNAWGRNSPPTLLSSQQEQQPTNYYEIDQSQKQSNSVRKLPSQYHQQGQNALLQDSLPPSQQQQQQSQYHSRQQSRPERESSSQQQPDYYEIDQSQKRSNSGRQSPSLEKPSHYYSTQQFQQQNRPVRKSPEQPQKRSQSVQESQSRQRNESEQNPLYLSSRYDEIIQPRVESDEEHLKPIYNRYRVISGDFELRESPSNLSSHSNDSKQMQLIFKATLQGTEVQKRAKNSIYELAGDRSRTQSISNLNKQNNSNSHQTPTNTNRRNHEQEYQIRLNSDSHNVQSPRIITQPDRDDLSPTVNYPAFQPPSSPHEPIKRPIYDEYQSQLPNPLASTNTNIHSANHNDLDDIRQRSRSSSQNYISATYERNPLKQANSTPFLTSPKSKYFFGENIQSRISDDDEDKEEEEEEEEDNDDDDGDDDETECETFGHNSQPRPFLNTNIRRNYDNPYIANSRFLTNGNNYSDNLQFEQHTDVGTAVFGGSLTEQRRSSNEVQSMMEKTRDSSHNSPTHTSNKQISPHIDYEQPDTYHVSTNYNGAGQTISSSASATDFQRQNQNNDNYYEDNVGSNIEQSPYKINQNRDTDNQPEYENSYEQNNGDTEEYQNDDRDLPERDNQNYINDDDDDDDDDDESRHPIPPPPSSVNALLTQNPVRNIPQQYPPMQYPIINPTGGSQANISNTKQKEKKKGFFGFLSKDTPKNVDNNKTRSSKKKSKR